MEGRRDAGSAVSECAEGDYAHRRIGGNATMAIVCGNRARGPALLALEHDALLELLVRAQLDAQLAALEPGGLHDDQLRTGAELPDTIGPGSSLRAT